MLWILQYYIRQSQLPNTSCLKDFLTKFIATIVLRCFFIQNENFKNDIPQNCPIFNIEKYLSTTLHGLNVAHQFRKEE